MTHSNDPYLGAGGRLERLLVQGGLFLAAAFLISGLGGWTRTSARPAQPVAGPADPPSLTTAAEKMRGELSLARAQLDRAQAVLAYSGKYQIPADLAAAIYDIARTERIDPAIAFQLVEVESRFQRTARSSAEALGYTQIQLATARRYDRTVTRDRLFERDLNLKLGFRYLRDLLAEFDGDEHLALLAYNRGPARVEQILSEGGDPANGYSSAVLRENRRTPALRGTAAN